MTPSKILVTGATGVVGRRLVPHLLKNGHRVLVVARPSDRREGLVKAGATSVDADLFDSASLRRAVTGCNVVINLATHMPTSSSQMIHLAAWKENDRVRKEGSSNLVDASLAEGVNRFIQESFAPVYPDSGDRWIGEEDAAAAGSLQPHGPGRGAIRAALHEVRRHGRGAPIRVVLWPGLPVHDRRDPPGQGRKGPSSGLARRLLLVGLTRRRGDRRGRRPRHSRGRLQRRGRRADDAARVLRLVGARLRRSAAQAGCILDAVAPRKPR